MEKILVAIDGKHGAWEALSHACSLAKRMDVQLNVLLVRPAGVGKRRAAGSEIENEIRQRLQLHIEQAKAEGIEINFFLTEGNYADEVIDFANHNRITLLISELRQAGGGRSTTRELEALRALKHRLTCRMEVVAQKKNTSTH